MSADINDGGPAFPGTEEHGCNSGWSGMTLRDYFAAKAMAALLREANSPDGSWHVEADASYLIANAMLKARQA